MFFLPFAVKSIEHAVHVCFIFLTDGRKMISSRVGHPYFLTDGERDAFAFFDCLRCFLWNLCHDIGMIRKF